MDKRRIYLYINLPLNVAIVLYRNLLKTNFS